jgi:hypothetical protein
MSTESTEAGKFNKEVGKDALLEDIEQVAAELGRPPNSAEYTDYGKWTAGAVLYYFDNWVEVLQELDLDPDATQHRAGYTEEELLEWIHAWVDEFGFVPRATDFSGPDSPMPNKTTYHNRFGSWTEALRRAGYNPENRGGSA